MPLKDEQRKGIEQLLLGKDVLAVLPTGFGKSRIYQGFTTAKCMPGNMWPEFNLGYIAIEKYCDRSTQQAKSAWIYRSKPFRTVAR
jgi:hypothetical protein